MQRTKSNLLLILEQAQAELEISDAEFAKLFNVSGPMWNLVKSGRRNISMKILAGILHKFPQFSNYVLDFIRNR